jgi:hypothetical protein
MLRVLLVVTVGYLGAVATTTHDLVPAVGPVMVCSHLGCADPDPDVTPVAGDGTIEVTVSGSGV